MRFAEPVAAPGPRAVLGRRNPVAKLAAALVLTFILVATLDPVAPTIALTAELAVVPLFGVRYRVLIRRGWPLLASAAGLLVTMVLFAAERTGAVLVTIGPLTITSGVLSTGSGLAIRLLAVAVPGILVFATTDPTDLADALVQNTRVPARFAIGALAAFRLMPLLADEWRTLRMARRARGIDGGRNPVTQLKLFASTAFGLLVSAVRRGTRLATAMDARGFDAGVHRTVARRQFFRAADAGLILGAAALGTLALAASVAAGTFDPLLS